MPVVKTPNTTPEYFKLLPDSNQSMVKGLFISSDSNFEPHLITDYSYRTIETVFKKEKPEVLFFNNLFHMYISPLEQFIGKYPNYVATFLVRQSYLKTYGDIPYDVVCGNVLIFGTINLQTKNVDGKDYSVPYSVIEECVKIYDIQRNR